MPIFYSLIARDASVTLVEADSLSGNYPQITLKVLKENASGSGFKVVSNSEYNRNDHHILNMDVDIPTIYSMNRLIHTSVSVRRDSRK